MIIKQINNHENHFIDQEGNVYRKMNPWKTNQGYYHVKLDGKHYDVHRIVAEHFVENPNNLPVVNHIDGDRENQRLLDLDCQLLTR